jgi:tripartite-type tricarboxylate transporter receptor subunit TctC
MRSHPLMRTRALPLAAAGLLALAGCGGDDGQDAADAAAPGTPTSEATADAAGCGSGDTSLAGKTVRLVVGTDPGGGYDAYARMIAPHLAEQLGGEVVVENEPGAGGLKAVNSLLAGKKDGTHLMIMNAQGNVSSRIAGVQGANFDIDALSYIGRVASEPEIITGAVDGPYKSWDDVVAADDNPKIGTTGLGSAAYINGALVNEVFDLGGELITGYDSASEAELGLVSGDVQLLPGNQSSRLEQIEAGDAIALLVLDAERSEELPDIPTILEQDLSAEDQDLVEAHNALGEIGRPLIGPPGLEEEALNDLRQAMQCAFESEELQSEAEESGRPISYLTGEETQALAEEVASPPQQYEEFLKKAYEGS